MRWRSARFLDCVRQGLYLDKRYSPGTVFTVTGAFALAMTKIVDFHSLSRVASWKESSPVTIVIATGAYQNIFLAAPQLTWYKRALELPLPDKLPGRDYAFSATEGRSIRGGSATRGSYFG